MVKKNIGLAISDKDGLVSMPYKILPNSKLPVEYSLDDSISVAVVGGVVVPDEESNDIVLKNVEYGIVLNTVEFFN